MSTSDGEALVTTLEQKRQLVDRKNGKVMSTDTE